MPSPEHMKATIEAYAAAHTRGDIDAIGALFAEDAVVTDPVDQPSHVGREAVVGFFAGTHEIGDSLELVVTGPVRAVGDFAAVPLRAISTVGTDRFGIDIIDVFTFNEDGLVSDMKAYWSGADLEAL